MPARAATASSVKLRPPDSRITASAASKTLSRSISFFRVKITSCTSDWSVVYHFRPHSLINMAIDAVQSENSISLRGVMELEQQLTRSGLRTFHHEGQ